MGQFMSRHGGGDTAYTVSCGFRNCLAPQRMLPPPLSSAPFPLHTRFAPPSTTTRTQPTGMQGLPGTNAQYSSVRFWDDRYGADGPPRDWFGGLSSFSGLLEEQLRKEDRLLVLGCGDSSLSHDLYQRGYTSITNIDYSPVCIEAMRKRHAECHGMVWTVMDARALTFSDESFDVVLEKGTLDAMMVEERDPWNVSAGTSELLDQVLKEFQRAWQDLHKCTHGDSSISQKQRRKRSEPSSAPWGPFHLHHLCSATLP